MLGDPALPHLFFVEGGALAVENALKIAFDWKSRHNEARRPGPPSSGTKILHLTQAFHGRSGYTLSLTNTEPIKTDRFPKFDWPRIDVPAITFPLDEHLDEVGRRRGAGPRPGAARRSPRTRTTSPRSSPSRSRARAATTTSGRSSSAGCSELVHEHDALFIFDEVQTGVGTTGTAWAYQQLGVQPDVVAFAKKAQLGGIMAGGRVDEVPDNVFAGVGPDQLDLGRRPDRHGPLPAAAGDHRGRGPDRGGRAEGRATSSTGCELAAAHRRGRATSAGAGCSSPSTCPTPAQRDRVVTDLREREQVLVLPCGERSIRFRPALSVSEDEIDEAVAAVGRPSRPDASERGATAVSHDGQLGRRRAAGARRST